MEKFSQRKRSKESTEKKNRRWKKGENITAKRGEDLQHLGRIPTMEKENKNGGKIYTTEVKGRQSVSTGNSVWYVTKVPYYE